MLRFSFLFFCLSLFWQDAFAFKINDFPLSAESQPLQKSWAEWNWPYFSNGLNNRASSDSISLISKLSLLTGVAEQTLNHDADRMVGEELHWWEGYCDVVSEAELKYEEPKAGVYSGTDFSSHDIKGILAYYFARHKNRWEQYREQEKDAWRGGDKSDGMEASDFYQLLGQAMGVEHQSLIVDFGIESEDKNGFYAFHEVHNYVLLKYENHLKPVVTSHGEKIEVTTVLTYIPELSDPCLGSCAVEKFQKKVSFRYYLGVDADRNVVSSRWLSSQTAAYLTHPSSYRIEEDGSVPEIVRDLIKKSTKPIPYL